MVAFLDTVSEASWCAAYWDLHRALGRWWPWAGKFVDIYYLDYAGGVAVDSSEAGLTASMLIRWCELWPATRLIDPWVRKRYMGYNPCHRTLNNSSNFQKPWACEAQSVTDLPRLLIGKVLLAPVLYRHMQVLTWTWELRTGRFVTHSLMVILKQTKLCQAMWVNREHFFL